MGEFGQHQECIHSRYTYGFEEVGIAEALCLGSQPRKPVRGNTTRSYICCGWKANDNMVLHDSRGNFSWQSFDSPTDTLLVGQSLRVGGVTRLVSRASEEENSNGSYNGHGTQKTCDVL
ncbi:hypothetical protein OIU85_002422 [Salix viminalis]|uniref:Bulb-type lectin domain-containing protein n=1 Tax=Salix viminalis TaxID=40686 RepID=A0A9Q0VNE1_SALVM|nr:hypothetical protein OIU85_002422 [Salix viminalis]